MKLSIQEKKILYAFACPNHHNTVTRLKWLTALTVDPKAKRWMLGLARKMENEVEEHWYPCFYQRLRMEMAKYYETKKYLRMVEKSTDYEEVLMQRNSTIGELMERKRIQDGAKEYQGHTYMDLARFDEAWRSAIFPRPCKTPVQ